VPEYPEIVVAVERLSDLVEGQILEGVRIGHPFLLRTAHPPISDVSGKVLRQVDRIQKQVVFGFREELYLVLHLMVSGRLSWRERGCKIPRRYGLVAFDFPSGSLLISERSTKKRASLHLVKGRAELARFDRGGLEVMQATLQTFTARIRDENRTLKRALTDQRILSGIGNAYSDEILLRARLSPFALTAHVTDHEVARLYRATRQVLLDWTERVREAAHGGLPQETRKTRLAMNVHGKYGESCPVCGTEIQRIRYAKRETNYCPRCQTEGRILADRVLSRLLKEDWPRTIEELEHGDV
jgi:formamidopyrimidine-DNA glycosylase